MINNTLKKSQTAVWGTLAAYFTLRRRTFIERTIKITEFAKKTSLSATLAVDPTRDFLAKFEEGGTKVSTQGKSLAVPIAARPNKSALIPPRFQIKNLQLTSVTNKNGKVTIQGARGTSLIRTGHGAFILQRFGRGGKQTRVLYALERSVPIPATLGFDKVVRATIDEVWEGECGAAVERAISTAK
ncbi:MAG: hypothetical protein ABJB33_02600 [Gemmatimonadota bacterium]